MRHFRIRSAIVFVLLVSGVAGLVCWIVLAPPSEKSLHARERKEFMARYEPITNEMNEREIHALLGKYRCKVEEYSPRRRSWRNEELPGEAVRTKTYEYPPIDGGIEGTAFIMVFFDRYGQVLGKDRGAWDD